MPQSYPSALAGALSMCDTWPIRGWTAGWLDVGSLATWDVLLQVGQHGPVLLGSGTIIHAGMGVGLEAANRVNASAAWMFARETVVEAIFMHVLCSSIRAAALC